MFMIVEPHQHTQYEELIGELCWKAFERYWILEHDLDKRKATYFVALDDEENYLGGAWLIKKSSQKFLKETGVASPHLRRCQYIWEIGGIHTCLKLDNGGAGAKAFYQALHQQLLTYSQENGFDYAVVHTSSAERGHLQAYGQWPISGYIINPREYTMLYCFLKLKKDHS